MMTIKNFLIKGLLWITNRLQTNEPSSQRFLVVSTTGLGDTLWGTPSIRALRQMHPQAYIAALTSTVGKEVLTGNPHLDELFVVKEPALGSLIRLFFRIRKRKFSTALILHASQRPVLPFCRLVGCSEIIGTKDINKGLDFILTKGVDKKHVHEIQRRAEIISHAGARLVDSSFELVLEEKDVKAAAKFLESCPPYVPIIGMHPGAKDKFKQWPPEYFIEVGKRLKAHLGCELVITGSSSEKALVEQIAAQIPGALVVCGQLSLKALAALIQKMTLFVANDTGPMHVALSVRTPVVALFAPTDSTLCGPFQPKKAKVIQKPRTCSPCLRKKCRDPFCMLQISPNEVYEEALKLYYA